MALRRFASQSVSMFGIRAAVQPAMAEHALGAAFSRAFATVVDGLKYAKSHEWVKLDGDTATVGITDFAQSELGDVVYVELPEVGTVVKKGETFGVIESVKAATDLYSPMSGEVLETNSVLVDDPGQVNSAPYDSWIMKVKVSTPDEAGDLLQAGDYSEHCEAGGH